MSRISALIVDDEPLARERLRGLLQSERTIEVVGECGDGNEALVAIQAARPQVVFLDVQMPGCDGFELAARLPESGRPLLVFVTAHDRYALEAFNLQAVDYLLKPFGADRLHQALERVQAQLDAPPAARAGSTGGTGPRLSFRIEGRIVFFQAPEIAWVAADGDRAVLHLRDRRVVVHEALAAIEPRLEAAGFARVNRTALVRLDQVREVRPAEGGDYTVVLRDRTELPLGRGWLNRFTGGGRG